jgi:hypothetical protein
MYDEGVMIAACWSVLLGCVVGKLKERLYFLVRNDKGLPVLADFESALYVSPDYNLRESFLLESGFHHFPQSRHLPCGILQ